MITVRYRDVGPLVVGKRAYVWPIDHPSQYVSNTCWAETSPVVGISPHSDKRGPVFWTESGTRYVPADTDESLPKATGRRAKA